MGVSGERLFWLGGRLAQGPQPVGRRSAGDGHHQARELTLAYETRCHCPFKRLLLTVRGGGRSAIQHCSRNAASTFRRARILPIGRGLPWGGLTLWVPRDGAVPAGAYQAVVAGNGHDALVAYNDCAVGVDLRRGELGSSVVSLGRSSRWRRSAGAACWRSRSWA